MKNSDNLLNTADSVIISSKHLRLLDNIFRKHYLPDASPDFQKQIIKWAKVVLSEERKNWAESRADLIDIWWHLNRKEEAQKRAIAKNKRYEPFKKVFKKLQKQQIEKYQKADKTLSANAFVMWFMKNKADSMKIPYLKSNQTNQLIKLAQINNREFKKLSNAEADTSHLVEDRFVL